MTVSAQIVAMPGIAAASVVMATASNVDNLQAAGLGQFAVRPNDLLVVVSGSAADCAAALARADALLKAPAATAGATAADGPPVLASVQMAVARDPTATLALISVPGDYAAAEAMKALRLGLDVMVFSDNVPPSAELALKRYAEDHGLMVMGPDCGTAIVNGIPLGFANVVRSGPIGVVAASGTGLQEVTARIDQLGSGISQALGTGGLDLSEVIGGISMLHGLAALDRDPATAVIVLVSKPPAAAVAAHVFARAEACSKPVVVVFLGAAAAPVAGSGVHVAATLAEAADIAVGLAKTGKPGAEAPGLAPERLAGLAALARSMAPGQKFVRGLFCGGTFS
jgi:FdrA protein